MVAPLWVAFQANLGTLLRSCEHGDTLGAQRRPCTHWVRGSKDKWIEQQRAEGWRIVAVELAENAISLPWLEPAVKRTIVLLGHEWHGVPDEQAEAADVCVEIPIVGQGASLNVALADSLVLYRLAGLS